MIGKISSGKNFGTAIDYITGCRDRSKKATILLHSDGVLCTDHKTIAACLTAASRKGHHKLSSPVKHISLSFSPQDAERITDDLMAKIATEYMERMGIKDTEFVVCRHHDSKHPHCHLVFSRVNKRGKLISDSNEKRRNMMVCKYLTAKFGLFIPAGKKAVNVGRLHGRDKYKYEMLLKVFISKLRATDWNEFDEQLKGFGIKLKFHYNNVNGQLMGVSFSDGQHSYSGKQLDCSLAFARLSGQFGDLRQLAHDNVETWYEQKKERLLSRYLFDRRSTRNIEMAFPPFRDLYPHGIYDAPIPDIHNLLSHTSQSDSDLADGGIILSAGGTDGYVSLDLMVHLLLMPYHSQLTAGGGGGGGNDRGWRDKDDDKDKFRFNFKGVKRTHSKGRGR